MKATTKAKLLLTTMLYTGSGFAPQETLANSYISGSTFSREQTINVLSDENSSCGSDFDCRTKTIQRSITLHRHPHFYNTMNVALKNGPQAGSEMLEGYTNTMKSIFAVNGANTAMQMVPNNGRSKYLKQGTAAAARLADKNFKPTYNNLALDQPEELRKQKAYQFHKIRGRSNPEMRKYLTSEEGKLSLEKTAYFSHKLDGVVNASPERADALEREFSKEFGYTINDVKSLKNLYIDTANSLEGGHDLKLDMQTAERIAISHESSIRPLIEQKKELESLKKDFESGNEALKEKIDELERKHKSDTEAFHKKSTEAIEEDIGFSIEEMENKRERSADEALNEFKSNPVTIGGVNLYSDSDTKDSLRGIAATGEFIGTTLQALGAGEEAGKIVQITNSALRAVDAVQYFSNIDLSSFNSAAQLTTAMGSLTNIASAVSFVASLSGGADDPQQKMMEQLFAAIQEILDNQMRILEGIDNLKEGQASIMYSLNAVSKSIDALQQGQLEQVQIFTSRFNRIEAKIDMTYLDTQARLESIADSLKLKDLFDALNAEENAKDLDAFGPADDRLQELRNLAEGLTKISGAIRQHPYLEVDTPPKLLYENSISGLPKDMKLDTGDMAEQMLRIGVNERRGYYAEILGPICEQKGTCSTLEDIPNAARLRGLTLLYMKAANSLSQTREGQKFLIGNRDKTFMLLQNEISKIRNASEHARQIVPETFKLYQDSIHKIETLIKDYGNLAVKAVLGQQDRLEISHSTTREVVKTVAGEKAFVQGAFFLSSHEVGSLTPPSASRTEIMTDFITGDFAKEERGINVALHLQLGSLSREAYLIKERQHQREKNADWSFYHLFNLALPVNADRNRIVHLMSDIDGASGLINSALDEGSLKGTLGGFGISSHATTYHFIIKPANCGLSFYIYPSHSFCISKVQSAWLSDKPVDIAQEEFHQRPILYPQPDTIQSFSEDYYKIKKILRKDFYESRQLREIATLQAAREVGEAMVDDWNGSVEGIAPKALNSVPTLANNVEVKSLLAKLQKTFQQSADARLMYDTALRLGYGEDCLAHSPKISLHASYLDNGDIPTTSTLANGELNSVSGLLPVFQQLVALERIFDSYKDLSAAFPDAEDLADECAPGLSGAEQLNELTEIYSNWIDDGAIPANR